MGIPEIVRAPYLCKPEVDAKNTFKNVLQPLTKSRFCLELLSLGCLITSTTTNTSELSACARYGSKGFTYINSSTPTKAEGLMLS